MTKKYAPPVPNPGYHRPKDLPYFHELLGAADLSQRKAGPALGLNERSIRYKMAGETQWTYAEQFALECLADAKLRERSAGVAESAPEYTAPARTQWFRVEQRRLTAADAGKLVVGKDRFGVPIQGILSKDGFGLVVKSVDGLDVHNIPMDRVELYALLDPPPTT